MFEVQMQLTLLLFNTSRTHTFSPLGHNQPTEYSNHNKQQHSQKKQHGRTTKCRWFLNALPFAFLNAEKLSHL